MTVAVTGATGFVGQALLDQAGEAGMSIRALARRPQPARAGVEWIAGDLADRAALAALVHGAEAVIHIAGVVNARDHAEFEAGNVAGSLRVVEAALAAGVPRLVHVSSLAAREPQLSAYGASKLRSERVVKASALDWTIVRPPAVYGPRDRDMFEMFRAARWGVLPVPAGGRASVIHVADLAALLLALLPPGEDVSHRTFEPDDGRAGGWSNEELARVIGWAMGRRPRIIGVSPAMLRRGARIDGLLRRRRARLTPDRASYLAHPDWAVSEGACPPPARWRPRVPTREGLKATAAWYRREGWL